MNLDKITYCKICGKEILEDWHKSKVKGRILDTCSRSCSCSRNPKRNPSFQRNELRFEMWKNFAEADIGSKGSSNRGEMLNPIKDRIKQFLLKEQDNKCAICGQLNEWNGKPFTLILDHIDGSPINHLRKNLRLICPICDTQLPTHGSKNRGNGRFSERLRYYRQKKLTLEA